MQAQAITEAAIEVQNKGVDVNVEIEIPLVGLLNEYKYMRDVVKQAIL